MAPASGDVAEEPRRRSWIGLDLRPLKGSRDYRALFAAGFVGTIGAQGTYVVVPYQMKQLTGSVLAVGLLGAVEIVPLIVFGLLGGAFADSVNKRTIIVWTEATMLLATCALLLNALSAHPKTWVLYVVAAVLASADGLQRPSLDAIVPRLVPHDQLAAASSLSVFRWTFGSILGPITGGTVAVAVGPAAWYAIDVATFSVTIACFLLLASSPPSHDAARPSLSQVFAGFGYALSRRDLLGDLSRGLLRDALRLPRCAVPVHRRALPRAVRAWPALRGAADRGARRVAHVAVGGARAPPRSRDRRGRGGLGARRSLRSGSRRASWSASWRSSWPAGPTR